VRLGGMSRVGRLFALCELTLRAARNASLVKPFSVWCDPPCLETREQNTGAATGSGAEVALSDAAVAELERCGVADVPMPDDIDVVGFSDDAPVARAVFDRVSIGVTGLHRAPTSRSKRALRDTPILQGTVRREHVWKSKRPPRYIHILRAQRLPSSASSPSSGCVRGCWCRGSGATRLGRPCLGAVCRVVVVVARRQKMVPPLRAECGLSVAARHLRLLWWHSAPIGHLLFADVLT
jgi:hypothetical protein